MRSGRSGARMPRYLRNGALTAVALCCLALLAGLAGCGRKAKPEPRSACLPAAHYHAQG
jgi:hypothetical protein